MNSALLLYYCNNLVIVWLFGEEKKSQHPWGGIGWGGHRCSWSASFSCKDSLKPKRVDDGMAQDRADGTTAVGPRRSILHPWSESAAPRSLPVRVSPPDNLSLDAHLRPHISGLENILNPQHTKPGLNQKADTSWYHTGSECVFPHQHILKKHIILEN